MTDTNLNTNTRNEDPSNSINSKKLKIDNSDKNINNNIDNNILSNQIKD